MDFGSERGWLLEMLDVKLSQWTLSAKLPAHRAD